MCGDKAEIHRFGWHIASCLAEVERRELLAGYWVCHVDWLAQPASQSFAGDVKGVFPLSLSEVVGGSIGTG